MYMIAEISQYVAVASFSEAWIEIGKQQEKRLAEQVASFSEAWIEIGGGSVFGGIAMSPPSRRRGLKYLATYISFRC